MASEVMHSVVRRPRERPQLFVQWRFRPGAGDRRVTGSNPGLGRHSTSSINPRLLFMDYLSFMSNLQMTP